MRLTDLEATETLFLLEHTLAPTNHSRSTLGRVARKIREEATHADIARKLLSACELAALWLQENNHTGYALDALMTAISKAKNSQLQTSPP